LDNNNEWRDDQKKLTKKILERVDIVAFTVDCSGINKGCTLNHLDGSYGYIKLKDALNYKWDIYEYETDKLIGSYVSIEDLIEQGWKVST